MGNGNMSIDMEILRIFIPNLLSANVCVICVLILFFFNHKALKVSQVLNIFCVYENH